MVAQVGGREAPRTCCHGKGQQGLLGSARPPPIFRMNRPALTLKGHNKSMSGFLGNTDNHCYFRIIFIVNFSIVFWNVLSPANTVVGVQRSFCGCKIYVPHLILLNVVLAVRLNVVLLKINDPQEIMALNWELVEWIFLWPYPGHPPISKLRTFCSFHDLLWCSSQVTSAEFQTFYWRLWDFCTKKITIFLQTKTCSGFEFVSVFFWGDCLHHWIQSG